MSFTGTLLPYQVDAVDQMCDKGSMLIAYDFGLGKTVLTIAALERLMDEKKINEPGIIICLSSIKYQWLHQIEKFTNGSSKSVVIDGTPKQRAEQYKKIQNWGASGIDYIIINYEQVVNDWEYVKKLPRGFVVIDEATAIKSFKSKRSRHTKRLINAPYRFALTGTPIENGKPEELFSIMQFVDPQVLGRFDIFDQAFIVRNVWGAVDRYRNLPTLHNKIKESCARKSQKDKDVAPYLPDSIHKDPIFVSLDRKSAILYNKIVKDVIYDLEEAQTLFGSSFNVLTHYGYQSKYGDSATKLQGKIMSKIGCLKMLCQHPDLLVTSAQKYVAQNGQGSAYAYELLSNGDLDGVTSAIKLETLISYVKDFLDQNENNKVVIFATYIDITDKIIKKLGEHRCRAYTGQIDSKTKEVNKIDFNNNPNIRVLVSSDAGGYGVDLPAANLLVNYDLPWSSGAAAQRNGRIKRASSKWPSIVIQDILTSGSIEVRQYEALQQKNAVATAVIDGEGINDKGGVTLTAGSLSNFLRNTSV